MKKMFIISALFVFIGACPLFGMQDPAKEKARLQRELFAYKRAVDRDPAFENSAAIRRDLLGKCKQQRMYQAMRSLGQYSPTWQRKQSVYQEDGVAIQPLSAPAHAVVGPELLVQSSSSSE